MDVQTIGFMLLKFIVADVLLAICCAGKEILVTQAVCDVHNTYTIKAGGEIVVNFNRTHELNLTGVCILTFKGASSGLDICAHFGPYGPTESVWGAIYTCRDRLRYYYEGELWKEGVSCYGFKFDPLCTTERTVYAVYNYNISAIYDSRVRIRLTASRIVTTTPFTTRKTTHYWHNNNYDDSGEDNEDDNEHKKEPKYVYGLKVIGIIVAAMLVLCIGIQFCRKEHSEDNTLESDEEVEAPSTVTRSYDHNEDQTASHPLSTYREQDDDVDSDDDDYNDVDVVFVVDDDDDDYDNDDAGESGDIPSQFEPPRYDATSPSQSTSQPQPMYTDDAPSYSAVMANKSKYAYDGSTDNQGPGSSCDTAPPFTVNQPIHLDELGAHDFNGEDTTPTVPPPDYSDIPPPPPYPGV